jgi:crotonobetainyl-CoA:carnitine CoA-transferase CaiB-like acyl-CoA transferase
VNGPYSGLRVLDISHVIAGPFCARLLADMGADVVRIEGPSGDIMRQFPARYGETLSSGYAQYNNGKHSVCLNLKSDGGRRAALALAARSDVIIENFSPGAFERLGLGYNVLHDLNPKIILCSLSAFGASGPYSSLSGYGLVAEAYSGLMSLTGEEGGSPMHFGTPLADMNAAVHATAAIGAALYRRAATGEGAHIDLSSFDALFSMIDQAVALESFTRGESRFPRYGKTHGTSVPSAVVRTADGSYVAYSAVGDRLFVELASAIGQPALVEDARFASFVARIENREDLYKLVENFAGTVSSADELVEQFTTRGISAARVRSVSENLEDPHLLARGTLQRVDIDGIGEVVMQVAPYRIDGAAMRPQFAAEELGQSTDTILAEVGLSQGERQALYDRGDAIRIP